MVYATCKRGFGRREFSMISGNPNCLSFKRWAEEGGVYGGNLEKIKTPPCVFKKLLTLGPLVSLSHFLIITRPFSRNPGEKSIKIFSA